MLNIYDDCCFRDAYTEVDKIMELGRFDKMPDAVATIIHTIKLLEMVHKNDNFPQQVEDAVVEMIRQKRIPLEEMRQWKLE